MIQVPCTVKPHLVDTSLEWTPPLNGHLGPVPPNFPIDSMYKRPHYSGHLCSVDSGHLLPVPRDNIPVHSGHFPPVDTCPSTVDRPNTLWMQPFYSLIYYELQTIMIIPKTRLLITVKTVWKHWTLTLKQVNKCEIRLGCACAGQLGVC